MKSWSWPPTNSDLCCKKYKWWIETRSNLCCKIDKWRNEEKHCAPCAHTRTCISDWSNGSAANVHHALFPVPYHQHKLAALLNLIFWPHGVCLLWPGGHGPHIYHGRWHRYRWQHLCFSHCLGAWHPGSANVLSGGQRLSTSHSVPFETCLLES